MRGLDPDVQARLVKICGLLGSDHAGERSAAAWQTTRLLRAQGVTWQDVLTPAPAVPAPARGTHATTALWALGFRDLLTDREAAFLADISRCRRITPKQEDWLDAIAARLRAGGAA